MNYIEILGQKAQDAKKSLATASTGKKNQILKRIADKLLEKQSDILAANEKDIANARDNGISETMVDRLKLTGERIAGIADACIQLTNLEDPVGEVIEGSTRPNGMKITKVRVPMGVVGIIYESRPNVTVDAAILNRTRIPLIPGSHQLFGHFQPLAGPRRQKIWIISIQTMCL